MKNRALLILLISFLTLSFYAFQLPKNIQKKVYKEVKSVFELEEFTLESLTIADDISANLTVEINDFYKIVNNTNTVGYAFISKAPSKTDEFDYLVLFDQEFIIAKTKVLIYREDYGGEIGSKRWLRQFDGLTSDVTLDYGNDIVPISGATISAVSMTNAVNNVLKSVEVLKQANQL